MYAFLLGYKLSFFRYTSLVNLSNSYGYSTEHPPRLTKKILIYPYNKITYITFILIDIIFA